MIEKIVPFLCFDSWLNLLQYVDNEGKTPLILACLRADLLHVAKTFTQLGASVNAYRLGSHVGTPLHYASKRGIDQTVALFLSHGASPLVMNDDCETALDLARAKNHDRELYLPFLWLAAGLLWAKFFLEA